METPKSHHARGLAASVAQLRHRRPILLSFLLFSFVLYGVFVVLPNPDELRVPLGDFDDHRRHGSSDGPRQPRHDLLLDNEGCIVPALEPFSDEVKKYVKKYRRITCDQPPPLVRSNGTALFVDQNALTAYRVRGVSCCFTAMWRTPGPDWQADPGRDGPLHDQVIYGNDVRFANECTPFDTEAVVPHEFVRVTCTESRRGTQVYKDFHAFVPERRPRGHGPGAGAQQELASEEALNVLIVGIDSLSRLNLIRKMNRTLTLVGSELRGVGMLGYNKVEDNTFPNLVPLLSGMNVPELRNACWPNESAHFDACPWVWKAFNREGYVSMFAEDTAWMGLFHYMKKGFVNQPTDFDPRPLMYLGEAELGRGGGYTAQFCIGQRHQIEVLFDYGRKFVDAMALQGRKFFSIIWGTSLSHDDVNLPDEADARYEALLKHIVGTGLLNKTALVFMSDHGLRFGPILSTQQGQLENLMPVMYLVLPQWVRDRYPAAVRNLEANRRSLVTAFDLHETLLNFMDLRTLEAERIAADAAFHVRDGPPRGISLFLPISASRTCNDAGIPPSYCACQHLDDADVNDAEVRNAARSVVQNVNAALESSVSSRGCWRLQLDEVLYARSGLQLLARTNASREVHVSLRTSPGGALFAATVRRDVKSGAMHVAGTVSRLNAYGNDSWCTNTAALKPLCYCSKPPQTTIS